MIQRTETKTVIDHYETGKLARSERLAAGLIVRQVAAEMGTGVAYIYDLEMGRRNWNERLISAYSAAVKSAKKKAGK